MFLSKKCHPPAGCVPCSLWMTLFLSSYSFLVLSVISICTMLTVIVFILQLLRCRLDSRVDGLGTVCHFGNLFEDNSIVNSLMRIFAPGERSVVLAKNGRNGFYIFSHPFELIDDQMAGVFLVCLVNLFRCETACTWDRSKEIIRMSRSVKRNIPSCLCPRSSLRRMGMYDTADIRILFVQFEMGWCVG